MFHFYLVAPTVGEFSNWFKMMHHANSGNKSLLCIRSHLPRLSVLTGGIRTKLIHQRFPAHLTVKILL